MHISGDGIFSQRCQAFLERELNIRKALLTTSCTHALELAALLLDLKPGDEVIVPAFTFVSTVNAFALHGARPVFADIRPDTLNLDERLLPSLITSKTRAIVPMHYAGVGCEMGSILALAAEHGLHVIEDNAHGLFGRYHGKSLGSFGCLATQSFHETKNFSCGEGGALLINDPALIERAEIIRQKGTNRNRFLNGEVDKYTWVDCGSSYSPSDILAAVLLAQFEVRASIELKRRQLWETYFEGLSVWAAEWGVQLPCVPDHCQQTHHIFHLRLPNSKLRDSLIRHLRSQDILSVFHYPPLHLSAMGRRLGGWDGQCPVTETVSEQLLRLPIYYGLSEDDQSRVINSVRRFKFRASGHVHQIGEVLSTERAGELPMAARSQTVATS